MQAIKLIANIGADGKISLPDSLQHIFHHEVEIILLFKPKKSDSAEIPTPSSNIFEAIDRITTVYTQSEEPELDAQNIYKRRTENHDREIRFN